MIQLPPYTVRHSKRAKRILIKIIPGKGVEVVLPYGTDMSDAKEAVHRRKEWITKTICEMEEKGLDVFGAKLTLPEHLPLRALGKVIPVNCIPSGGRPRLRRNAGTIKLSGNLEDKEICFELLRKAVMQTARETLVPQLREMSEMTGLVYDSARIRIQKTRWGSCSSRGTISLNAGLLFLPPHYVQQVLLHELCHTVHLNHSSKFWNLVKRFNPYYLKLEQELSALNSFVPLWFKRK